MGKQPEAKLSTKIMKAMRARGCWVFKVHGSEYQPAGTPDICGVYKGSSVWVETKMPGNKTSEIQDYRINEIRKAGGHVVVAYDVQTAVQMLDHIDASTYTGDMCNCPYAHYINERE